MDSVHPLLIRLKVIHLGERDPGNNIMSRKRKGKYTLTEALDIVSEATTAQNYPDDGSGVAGDDDRPPGNIVFGQKKNE